MNSQVFCSCNTASHHFIVLIPFSAVVESTKQWESEAKSEVVFSMGAGGVVSDNDHSSSEMHIQYQVFWRVCSVVLAWLHTLSQQSSILRYRCTPRRSISLL